MYLLTDSSPSPSKDHTEWGIVCVQNESIAYHEFSTKNKNHYWAVLSVQLMQHFSFVGQSYLVAFSYNPINV